MQRLCKFFAKADFSQTPQKHAFSTLYSVFLFIFITLALSYLFAFSPLAPKAHIHAKTQLELYAKSMQNLALKCLQTLGLDECRLLEVQFEKSYVFTARINSLEDSLYMLDISGFVKNPVSANTQRITKRQILLKK